MNLIKPKKLEKSDTISIIAPAGLVDEDRILNSVKYFEGMGYKIKLGKNIFNRYRYMAGYDNERLYDLENAFLDTEVKAIFCARGGYGCLRLINKINYDVIKNNPKIFCGYSDITALSLMFLKKSGLITFSSPMPKGDFQPESIDSYTEMCFWNTLNEDNIVIKAPNLKTYKNGNAKGLMFGGNLATVVSLCGVDFLPDEKFIFFAEDLNEPVYKIDKYFRQLLNLECFRKNVSAIVLGDFLANDNEEQLDELFYEIAVELKIPVYGGYQITHGKTKVTLPVGGFGEIDNGVITLKY